MQNFTTQSQRPYKPACRVPAYFGAALLGLTAMLGCAEESDLSEVEAPVQALFAEGQWVNAKSGQSIPANAFKAGFEKNRNNVYYVCRVSLSNGNVEPGKLFADRCHIGLNGKEYHYESYQILVDPNHRLYWRDYGTPESPVAGGKEGSTTAYICQGGDHYEQDSDGNVLWTSEIPGKQIGNTCYTTYDGKEKAHEEGHFRRLGIR